jgi:hypothetical protein
LRTGGVGCPSARGFRFRVGVLLARRGVLLMGGQDRVMSASSFDGCNSRLVDLLLAMKVYASRPHDIGDIAVLADALGLTDVEAVLALAREKIRPRTSSRPGPACGRGSARPPGGPVTAGIDRAEVLDLVGGAIVAVHARSAHKGSWELQLDRCASVRRSPSSCSPRTSTAPGCSCTTSRSPSAYGRVAASSIQEPHVGRRRAIG